MRKAQAAENVVSGLVYMVAFSLVRLSCFELINSRNSRRRIREAVETLPRLLPPPSSCSLAVQCLRLAHTQAFMLGELVPLLQCLRLAHTQAFMLGELVSLL